MTKESKKPLKLFYCYAQKDKSFRNELDNHLTNVKRQELLSPWFDREISPGTEWEKEITTHLNTAHIILLLISADFMASNYCYNFEMKRALEKHKAGTARVIPIIIRTTDWKDTPFSFLQILPTGAKPVSKWPDRDDAFWDIVQGVRTVIHELRTLLEKQEWSDKGAALYNLKRYEEALAAYEEAIRLDPNHASAYHGKGICLRNLKRYEEALAAYEEAIRLDPNDASAYHGKGAALNGLKRYQEALAALEQAIRLDPNHAPAYHNKGAALYDLKRYQEALAAFEQAIRLDPNHAPAYHGKGICLRNLKRYEEALAAYKEAIHLDPNHAPAYHGKGICLRNLKRYQEALAAFEEAIRLAPNHGPVFFVVGKIAALNGLRRLSLQTQKVKRGTTVFRKRPSAQVQ